MWTAVDEVQAYGKYKRADTQKDRREGSLIGIGGLWKQHPANR
jgi:hypothetical protein